MIAVLESLTHTMMNVGSYEAYGYDSSSVMISDQIITGERCFPVNHWDMLAFLIPFLCVQDVVYTLSAR